MSGNHAEFAGTERFEIKRTLGMGGMGVVYEALDRERDELVALKCIRHFDAQGLLRFKEEFRALHDISHPNLVSLGELLEADGELFFTMELISGGDFLSYVRPGWPAAGASDSRRATAVAPTGGDDDASTRENSGSEERISALMATSYEEDKLRPALQQLALGISALHATGKVHRDIKPSNVLVSVDGRVVLVDFGLVAGARSDRSSTQTGVVGTAEYMAPEQAISGPIAPASDWYSMGTILYEALTGRLPHSGRSSLEILMAKQQRSPTPPRARQPGIPADLDELCMDLLRPEAAQRPAEAEILARLGVVSHEARSPRRAPTSTGMTVSTPFVGREAELDQLHAAFYGSREAAQIVVLQGESGLGKSHLMEHFTGMLGREHLDLVVLDSRCYERESVAYKAFDGIADALSRHMAELGNEEAAALLPLRAGLLPRLFQVLQRVEVIAQAPEEADLPDAHEQRRRMFGAFRELFMRLVKRHPVVLCIDDIQWTDADSLILLQELVAHPQDIPLLVLVTMRPVVDADRRNVLAKVQSAAPTTLIDVCELSRSQAQDLARLLMPNRDESLLRSVARETSGHPLFIQELARHLESESSETAGSLDEALLARIERLHPEARRLLEVVCVAGSPVAHEVVEAAAEMERAAQATAARALRVAHLVRTDGVRSTDTIVAYHDRIRELVSQRLDPAKKRHWHARLALALEQRGAAKSDPQTLVHHAEAAGRVKRAAIYAEAAAVYAMNAMAFDQAAELFGTALRLGSYDDQARRALQMSRATALVNAGRGPEAAESLMIAADGADTATRLQCQGRAAEQWIFTGHIERGLEVIGEALVEIGEPLAAGPRRALISLLWHRLRIRLHGRRSKIRFESQIAPEVLHRLDVLKSVAHGFGTVDTIRGADFNARFLVLAQRVGEPRRLLQALGLEIGYLAAQAGRTGRRARLMFKELDRLVESCGGDSYALTWVTLVDGFASYFEGRFGAAAELFSRAELAFQSETTGTTWERNNTRVFRLISLRWMGAFGQCRRLAAQSMRDAEQRGDRFLATSLLPFSSHPALAGQSKDEGSGAAADMSWTPPEGGYHVQHWYELEARVEGALFEGKAADVLESQTSAFEALKSSQLLRVQLLRCVSGGLRARILVAAAPEHPNSGDCLKKARALARKLEREGVDYASVLALLLRAAIATQGAQRDLAQAVDYLRRAISTADAADMAFHAAAGRYRLGMLIGGDEGLEAIERAREWAATEAVSDLDRVVEVAAPGFCEA